MGIMEAIKKAILTKDPIQTEMVVEGGDTTVTFIPQETGSVVMEILDLTSFASIELANRIELPGLVATTLEAQYGNPSGFYTVKTKTGGFVTVGVSDRKVEVKIFNGDDNASARFTYSETEELLKTLRSYE
jgi:hypothetical protein